MLIKLDALFVALCPVTRRWTLQEGRLQQDWPRTSTFQTRLHALEDDPVRRLPLMEAQLAELDDDNNEDRESLQSSIENARTAAEFGVRRAQVQFYDSFCSQDIETMRQLWSAESHVRCIHPGMTSIEGRDAVLASWEQIFESPTGTFQIEPDNARIEICGQTAMCSCVEKINGSTATEALNVYKRESGTWKMTLHMAAQVSRFG